VASTAENGCDLKEHRDVFPELCNIAAFPTTVVATAYLANSALHLSPMTADSNTAQDAKRFAELSDNIAVDFRVKFVKHEEHIGHHKQEHYVRARVFELLLPHQRQAALERLF